MARLRYGTSCEKSESIIVIFCPFMKIKKVLILILMSHLFWINGYVTVCSSFMGKLRSIYFFAKNHAPQNNQQDSRRPLGVAGASGR